jgi:hypothetical protein
MGKKERIQKELDLLLEKIRFWRYIFFAIFSAIIGLVFGISQGKFVSNTVTIVFSILALVGIIISVKRIEYLQINYYNLLEELEKE